MDNQLYACALVEEDRISFCTEFALKHFVELCNNRCMRNNRKIKYL